jgi:hypothetical protein
LSEPDLDPEPELEPEGSDFEYDDPDPPLGDLSNGKDLFLLYPASISSTDNLDLGSVVGSQSIQSSESGKSIPANFRTVHSLRAPNSVSHIDFDDDSTVSGTNKFLNLEVLSMGLNLKDPPKLISKGSNPVVESNSIKAQSIELPTSAQMDFNVTDEKSPSIAGSLYSVDSKKSAIESQTNLAPVEAKSVKFDPTEKVRTFNCRMFNLYLIHVVCRDT